MKTRMQRIRRPQRRGVATMWFLAGFSALFVLFLFLIELGSLWTARVEVENSLEAAALAAAESWGTSAGTPMANWTNTARLRGQTLAAANNVNGNPVVIGTNLGTFNSMMNPNENSAYLPAPGAIGNLVFGAVTEMGNTVTFDATDAPQCGGALILVDATGSGNLDKGAPNDWGFAFQASTDPLLRITRIELNFATAQPNPGEGDGTAHLDTAMETFASAAVKDNSGNFQEDIFGFATLANDMLSGQIIASYPLAPNTQILRLDFSSDVGDPNGFAPGDRFRFSQGVKRTTGGAQIDGGTIAGTTITIFFNNATSISGPLAKNTFAGSINPRQIDPITGTFVVHTSLIPDLPQPPLGMGSTNGQSYLRFSGAGASSTEYFGVRAQATIAVPSLFGSYFGLPFSTHNVTVNTTAIYDCGNGLSRLVRVDNYTHP